MITARLSAYEEAQQTIKIAPGKPVEIKLVLIRTPTRGSVHVATLPEGGRIIFDDKNVGSGSVLLSDISFGHYTVEGVKQLNSVSRLTGSSVFTLSDTTRPAVTVSLSQKERFFEGQWLDEKKALAKEAARYAQVKVDNPITVETNVTPKLRSQLSGFADMAERIHGLLRPGDRIRCIDGEKSVLIWKRNTSMTEDFRMAMEAVTSATDFELPWGDDPAKSIRIDVGDKDPVADITFTLHRARADLPLLSLEISQLVNNKELVLRCRADGLITIIVNGGKQVIVDGISIAGDIALQRIELPEGDNPINITWIRPPERLMAMADQYDGHLTVPDSGQDLQAQEKKIISLIHGKSVKSLVRLSVGPDYEGAWQRRTTQPSGPLASQIDLSMDEIGPNDKPGEYRRVWIVRYQVDNSLTQRQLEVFYRVGGMIKDFGSDKFLRRSELEIRGMGADDR